ncbi:DNA methyltransferase [Streptomyces sp. NPDC001948]
MGPHRAKALHHRRPQARRDRARPFSGSGTTGPAARQLGRRYVGTDLNHNYHQLAIDRFAPTNSPPTTEPHNEPPEI